MNPIKICSQHSEHFGGTAHITRETTPEKFDQLIAGMVGYKLEHGGLYSQKTCGDWNALGVASYKGNPKLIYHIVQKGGNHLLSLGNKFGWTPLFCAANCKNQEDGFLAAKELIKLGADLNLATSSKCNDTKTGKTPKGATPLWAAAEKTKNLKLIKLLLKHGAVVPPGLGRQGRNLVRSAQVQIERERTAKRLFLAAYFKPENNESILKALPIELIRRIFEFIACD